jgi:hypothetical protein
VCTLGTYQEQIRELEKHCHEGLPCTHSSWAALAATSECVWDGSMFELPCGGSIEPFGADKRARGAVSWTSFSAPTAARLLLGLPLHVFGVEACLSFLGLNFGDLSEADKGT